MFRLSISTFLITTALMGASAVSAQDFPMTRDPLKWPFSQDSIWNMPIGSGAQYKAQPVDPAHIAAIMVDLDIIIMAPNAPLMDVYGTNQLWAADVTTSSRLLIHDGIVHLRLPIPRGYHTSEGYGTRPNNPSAILQSDGRTIVQTQPFQVSGPGGYATSGVRKVDPSRLLRSADVDIFSQGILGMHGGSGLSSLGGAIRVGELAPGSPPIRHALKIALPGAHYLYYDHQTKVGYRWPAPKHDSRAATSYGGTDPEAKIGVLRAIPPWIDIDSLGLETEPGRKIAWTMQNYGAYQSEEVPWARCMIAVEDGPEGNVADQFLLDWGYRMVTTKNPSSNPWHRDMLKIMAQFHIVTNNGPNSIGGGGIPLQPLAPPFASSDAVEPTISAQP